MNLDWNESIGNSIAFAVSLILAGFTIGFPWRLWDSKIKTRDNILWLMWIFVVTFNSRFIVEIAIGLVKGWFGWGS